MRLAVVFDTILSSNQIPCSKNLIAVLNRKGNFLPLQVCYLCNNHCLLEVISCCLVATEIFLLTINALMRIMYSHV